MAVEIPEIEESSNEKFLLQLTDNFTCRGGVVSACSLSDKLQLEIVALDSEGGSLKIVLLVVSIVVATALFAYFAMRE